MTDSEIVSHGAQGCIARNRFIVALIVVSALFLGVGFLVARFVKSPAEVAASAKPPKAGLITAALTKRSISNTIITRGDAAYFGTRDVVIDTSGLSGVSAVVTGHVPTVGQELKPGMVALEISSRPVLVLPGSLPMFRTLRVGVAGADVSEFKAALAGLGINPGDAKSDAFDVATANAVLALYAKVGYTAPTDASVSPTAVREAKAAVRSAQQQVRTAQQALDQAEQDPSKADPSNAQAALNDATATLSDAQSALSDAQKAVLPIVPPNEILFVPDLPRQVSKIDVGYGANVGSTPVMSISGTQLVVNAVLSAQDAAQVRVGALASIDLPGVDAIAMKVTQISGTNVALAPASSPSASQVAALAGQNVRVVIPISATNGEVWAVPLTALTAGPDGASRIEIVSDPESGRTRLVSVALGLSADGYVQVTGIGESLNANMQLVLGR